MATKTLGLFILTNWMGDPANISIGGVYAHFEQEGFLDHFYDDAGRMRVIEHGEWEPYVANAVVTEEVPPVPAGEQPLPETNHNSTNVLPEVMRDLTERMLKGVKSYGKPLQSFNGRDAIQDLYEELLDGACYIKQFMMERGNVQSSTVSA